MAVEKERNVCEWMMVAVSGEFYTIISREILFMTSLEVLKLESKKYSNAG